MLGGSGAERWRGHAHEPLASERQKVKLQRGWNCLADVSKLHGFFLCWRYVPQTSFFLIFQVSLALSFVDVNVSGQFDHYCRLNQTIASRFRRVLKPRSPRLFRVCNVHQPPWVIHLRLQERLPGPFRLRQLKTRQNLFMWDKLWYDWFKSGWFQQCVDFGQISVAPGTYDFFLSPKQLLRQAVAIATTTASATPRKMATPHASAKSGTQGTDVSWTWKVRPDELLCTWQNKNILDINGMFLTPYFANG
jgi:hypothetical protein